MQKKTGNDLLIVEDLTLLMMDDTSGAIAGAGTLYYTLGGALLVELGLGGHLRADGNGTGLNGVKVHAVAGRTPSDPLLRAVHAKVGERVRGVQTLLIEIGTGAGKRETVLDRLVERGVLRQETKKTLGVFRTTSTTVADTGYKKALVERVRAVLVDGAEPDDRTAALAGLLSASGTLPTLHRSIPWSGKVYQRAKELERSSWGAEAVNAAVLRTVAAVSAGTAVAVSST
ncbi:GPP34 family phosphoprotein [Streptomyces sp. FL06-04B]|uniref:GOLPH3/VPS74 family protein n=1 Tax=Streptomyces TaxID=1883 RepID=UPI0029B2BC06|nr:MULTISPECIES: GPP34 family phosphoprotein [unclassified Streptomyces]MDX3605208.1 GPP34 family phosphoprotein [Streptomyces sp. FL06-04B]MDX3736081.1 GPP34 family phosphoprotein [Streptomyces sp. ID01-15D]